MSGKVYGIVAEFNPFHNGHQHLVQKIREKDEDAVIVAVMSGHFMQRGIPAILDKWKRAEIATKCGIDLVIELPAVFSVQSADIFAAAAMKILNDIDIDVLAFGIENESIDNIKLVAETMLHSEKYESLLSMYLGSGNSYATASRMALEDLGLTVIKSNDTLAVSYVKQVLKNSYNFEFFAINRCGEDYNHTASQGEFLSATHIREILNGKLVDYRLLSETLPQSSFDEIYSVNDYIDIDDFSAVFQTCVLINDKEKLQQFDFTNEGLVNRILKFSNSNNDISKIIDEVATRRYNRAAVSRCICHMMLGITKDLMTETAVWEIDYIRVLAMNKTGKRILKSLPKDKVNVIQNLKRDIKKMNITDKISDYDIKATGLYSLVSQSVNANTDYLRKPYIESDY